MNKLTLQEAEQTLFAQLSSIYDNREARPIANLILEKISGYKKMDRVLNKSKTLSDPQLDQLEKFTHELLSFKPVQYVLQESWFYGLSFYVDANVLIPRPETEELVKWVLDEHDRKSAILDMGTGSGCIAITLKSKYPDDSITACDVSREALDVAKRNAHYNQTPVDFTELDFLKEAERNRLPFFDCIVSNPPYISQKDKKSMHPNVLAFEPHSALFVPEEDPYIFYRSLADFGIKKLTPKGRIYVELPAEASAAIKELFILKGYSSVESKTDMQGKDRLLKATLLL